MGMKHIFQFFSFQIAIVGWMIGFIYASIRSGMLLGFESFQKAWDD